MTNRYLEAPSPAGRGSTPLTDRTSSARSGLPGRALPATAPTRSARSTPSVTTGSLATAWCTACDFDGDGKGQWYRNRYVRGRKALPGAGEPGQGQFKVRRGWGANTNVIGYAGRALALVEGSIAQYELTDGWTPSVWDFWNPARRLQRAPQAGTWKPRSCMPLRTAWNAGNTMCSASVIGVDGRAKRTVDITVHGSPMMRLLLTEKHVVFLRPAGRDPALAAEMTVPKALRVPARFDAR